MLGPLLEVQMSKKCTPLWREAHFQVKMYKAHQVRSTFWSSDVEKVHTVVARSTFPSQNVKNTTCSDHFWRFRCGFARQAHFTWQAQYKTSEMLGDGRWFPEKGCILEHQICRFAKMILRDRCSISYDLASLFRGRRSTLARWSGKIARRIGTRPSAVHSTFHFWRMSCRTASFLMLSTWKIEDVSQNSFVFEAVKFKRWGRLVELLRFWCCQVQKLRKFRRIASFSNLQIDRQIEVEIEIEIDR